MIGPRQSALFGDEDEVSISRAKWVIALLFMLVVCAVVWAKFSILDEVATGQARVVPTLREQVIQSLEGGIVRSMDVRPDEVVEPGQVLAQLDPTRDEAEAEETASRYRTALAAATRLRAEMERKPLVFPPELHGYPELIATEIQLYNERTRSLSEKLAMFDTSLDLTRRELEIHERLLKSGAASNVEVIRLTREQVSLAMQRSDTAFEYELQVRQELSKADGELAALTPMMRSHSDVVSRLTLRSPVRGIVKNIEVSTIGGVVPPNGKLMDIVPLDDKLLIEAKISPRDIAFIRPGLRATVKITAYDYAVYGGLEGEVVTISADTIQDEINREQFYYRVQIRTGSDSLENKLGHSFAIVPGMVATVDIHTGQKSVLDYLLQPFNQATEALRER